MKKITILLVVSILLTLLSSCSGTQAQVAATTMPVYCFTEFLCQETPITVTRLITEEVSCVHDYALTVRQMKAIESAELIILSGAGLEEFMEDALHSAQNIADCSAGIQLLEGACHHHHEEDSQDEDAHGHAQGHEHETDPHIWLSPANASVMAQNVSDTLSRKYPEYASIFEKNLKKLKAQITALEQYAADSLSTLSSREIITFHDGFGYLADAFGLEILEAIEEESGSEPSAQELIGLIELVEHHSVKAIFVERSGSSSAASVISAETGVPVYTLDMAMAGDSWFDAMYHNIDTLKEALG